MIHTEAIGDVSRGAFLVVVPLGGIAGRTEVEVNYDVCPSQKTKPSLFI